MNLKVFSLIMLMSVALAIAQNNQGGTLVTAPIRPFAVQDTFPTAWANEIKGGPFTSTNLTGLNNIPLSRLEIGSLGYAQDTGLFHRLTSTNPVTWSPIDGSNFTNLPSATSFSGTLAITNGGSGATTAGGARTNLGLGETNDLTFQSLSIAGGSLSSAINLGNSVAMFTSTNNQDGVTFTFTGSERAYLGFDGLILYQGNLAFGTDNTSGAATTRTNLGLGASWLTNSTAPLFWTSVPASPTNSGTAGQVAYTNNYLYICISNNTWRRVQLGTW